MDDSNRNHSNTNLSNSILNNEGSEKSVSKTTGVYLENSGPPYTAGVPVLEIIRKLEDEKSLTKHDRIALKEAIHDQTRREKVLKALRDCELGTNKRFALRRLKALLHQNGAGEPSNKSLSEAQKNALLEGQTNSSTGFLHGQFHLWNHNSSRNIDNSAENSANIRSNENSISLRSIETSVHSKANENSVHLRSNENSVHLRSNENSVNIRSIDNSIRKKSGVDLLPSESVTEGAKMLMNEEDDEDNMDSTDDLLSTITKVVGNSSNYANTGMENICSKISARLNEFLIEYQKSKMGSRKFAVIVGDGSFNPLTRMHMRNYFLAKQELESRYGYVVLGSLLSPAHSVTVRERYRFNINEIIPSPHRLTISQLIVQDSKWLTIDPWEITRRRPMDYISLLDHTNEILKNNFLDIEIKLIYLCKANFIPKLSAETLKTKSYNCVCVCRSPDTENLRQTLVEDNAILDNSIDIVTSRKVRDKIKSGDPIDYLVGDVVSNYIINQRIGPKMNGLEDWSEEEKALPKLASRLPFGSNYSSQSKFDTSTSMLINETSESATSTNMTISQSNSENSIALPVIMPRRISSNAILASIHKSEAELNSIRKSSGNVDSNSINIKNNHDNTTNNNIVTNIDSNNINNNNSNNDKIINSSNNSPVINIENENKTTIQLSPNLSRTSTNEGIGILSTIRNIGNAVLHRGITNATSPTTTSSNESTPSIGTTSWLTRKSLRGSISFLPSITSNKDINNNNTNTNNTTNNTSNLTSFAKRASFKISLKSPNNQPINNITS